MILARVQPISDGRFVIKSPYDKLFVETVKEVPGMCWDPRAGGWAGYRDALQLAIPKLRGGVAKVVGAECIAPKPHPRVSLSDSFVLREYQRTAVDFISATSNTGSFLADSMGLGKSRSTLAAIVAMNEFPAVIVCPANVKHGWVKEAEKVGIETPLILNSRTPFDGKLSSTDGVVVVNYDILPFWVEALDSSVVTVFDEAQYLTNAKSQRSKAAKHIAHRSKRRVALSGTPMTNVPGDLWNPVDTISPNRFGNYFKYGMRYGNFHQEEIEKKKGDEVETIKVWNYKGASHLDELQARTKDFMLRRTKKDIALELPPKQRQLIEIDVGAEYNKADNWWTGDGKNQAQVALALAGMLKVPTAVELAETARGEGDDVIIFCCQKPCARAIQKTLAKKGIPAYLATGDEQPERRRENAERCKAEHGILIATIDAVGTGVDYLSYANVLIFAELHYVPTRILQAEDRAHRFGQKRNVHCYYIIALRTIDEAIRDVIRTKLRYFEDSIGSTGEELRDDLIGESDEEALLAVKQMAMEMEARWAAERR